MAASSSLSFDLTPPKLNNKLSSLYPQVYIREPALLASMRQKSLFHISSEAQKLATLDPPPNIFDTNILDYHLRTQQLPDLDRKKLRVSIPVSSDMLQGVSDEFHQEFTELKQEQSVLKKAIEKGNTETIQLRRELQLMRAQTESQLMRAQTELSAKEANLRNRAEISRIEASFNAKLEVEALKTQKLEVEAGQVRRDIQLTKEDLKFQRKETKRLFQQMHALRQETLNLKEMMKGQDERRMQLFRANLSVKFVEKIGKVGRYITDSNEDVNLHSTTRVVRLATSIKKDAFMKITKMPGKYYAVLQDLEQCIQIRNANAHETDQEMARLLLSRYKGTPEYHKWRLIIQYVHGKTIQELAEGPSKVVIEDIDPFTENDTFITKSES